MVHDCRKYIGKDDPFLPRLSFLTIALASVLTLGACNSSESQIVNEEEQTNPSPEEQRAETKEQPDADSTITAEVGLGDPREAFNSKYGEPGGDEEIATYMDDFMMVTFENHRAIHIDLHFGSDPDGEKTDEEIIAYIEERIPDDAQEQERKAPEQNEAQEIIHYTSEKLKSNVSEDSFGSHKSGEFFVLIEKLEDGQTHAAISLGRGQNVQ